MAIARGRRLQMDSMTQKEGWRYQTPEKPIVPNRLFANMMMIPLTLEFSGNGPDIVTTDTTIGSMEVRGFGFKVTLFYYLAPLLAM